MSDDTKALVERIAELEEVYRSHVRQVVADAAVIVRLERELAEARRDASGLRNGVPYREFCCHPDKCAGLSSCPRDPCCCD